MSRKRERENTKDARTLDVMRNDIFELLKDKKDFSEIELHDIKDSYILDCWYILKDGNTVERTLEYFKHVAKDKEGRRKVFVDHLKETLEYRKQLFWFVQNTEERTFDNTKLIYCIVQMTRLLKVEKNLTLSILLNEEKRIREIWNKELKGSF